MIYAAAVVGLHVMHMTRAGTAHVNTVIGPCTVEADSHDEAVGKVLRLVEGMKKAYGDGPDWSWRYSVNVRTDHLMRDPDTVTFGDLT